MPGSKTVALLAVRLPGRGSERSGGDSVGMLASESWIRRRCEGVGGRTRARELRYNPAPI